MSLHLPFRGLGLSSNLSVHDVPQPWALLSAHPGLFDVVEYSAPLDVAQARREASLFGVLWEARERVPVLFHPVHLNLYGPELEDVLALQHLDAHARAVGSAWVGNDVGWWHRRGQPLPGYLYLPPPMTALGLADAAAHAAHVASHLSVPLVLENPVAGWRRGGMHVLDFMAALHHRTGCPLLLDLGHLLSAQLAAGLPPDAGLDGFPLGAVVEVHIAGGVVTRSASGRGFYADDHSQPVREELFALLAELLGRLPALRALVFEGDGHPPDVAAQTLRRLRAQWPVRGAEALPWPASPTEALALSGASSPWTLFEAAYAAPTEEVEDAEGLAADRSYRLAVLADALDASWPLSRLVLAGTRPQLEAFAASPQFRALWEEGIGLRSAFGAWARDRLRERPEAAGLGALAFDSWAQAVAEGSRRGRFPSDLSEALFAVRALRRHLGTRAWASGVLETSGLEGLAQVLARAPRRPWEVRCVWEGGRLGVSPATNMEA
ncbi:MAG: DUF692 family multinuclear iron-containing protein [Myxococcaceae bacterium]